MSSLTSRLCLLSLVLALALGGACQSETPPAGSGGAPGSGGSTDGAGGLETGGTGGASTGGASSGGSGDGGGTGGNASGGTATGGGTASGGSGGSVGEQRTFVYVGSGDWGDAEPGLVTVYELDRA